MKNYLDFENEVKKLEQELSELKDPFNDNEAISEVNTDKILEIENGINEKLNGIYSNLNRWQKTLVARHEERPKAKYFIDNLFKNFINLSGDRQFGEDKSVLAGFALFENKSVLVIGQEKGDDLDSRIKRNFGMMKPEGYRKCIRLMQLANKFNIPIISFIDTPGAYPGKGAEERNQAEAIAKSIACSMSLEVPNISIIIGEGGSGGAIALASANKVLMLENAIYSVISPEGCASILWRDPKKSLEAADAMKLSANDLIDLGIIDEIIPEPKGGAHRYKEKVISHTHEILKNHLKEFEQLSGKEIFEQRKTKFLNIGRQGGLINSLESEPSRLGAKKNIFNFNIKLLLKNKKNIIIISIILLAIFLLIFF